MRLFVTLLFVFSLFLAGCASTPKTTLTTDKPRIDWVPEEVLTLSDAARILGEDCHLGDTSAYLDGATKVYTSSYSSDHADEVTGKTGTLYYMFEEYETAESAKISYESIRKANEKAPGVLPLTGIASEAYFHSDGTNFLFVLIRNENMMIRMKVNKTTSKTNLEEFMAVSRAFWQ